MGDEIQGDDDEDGMPKKPQVMPAPDLNVLGNVEAMEYEGAKLIEQDPTRFFHFEHGSSEPNSSETTDEKAKSTTTSSTTNLGKPTRLRDPLRDNSPTQTPFPQIIARSPRPDLRT